jgi:hypothetical protein
VITECPSATSGPFSTSLSTTTTTTVTDVSTDGTSSADVVTGAPRSDQDNSAVLIGAIVGSVAFVGLLALIGGVVYFLRKKRRNQSAAPEKPAAELQDRSNYGPIVAKPDYDVGIVDGATAARDSKSHYVDPALLMGGGLRSQPTGVATNYAEGVL